MSEFINIGVESPRRHLSNGVYFLVSYESDELSVVWLL
jgi:hypothetical protein